MTIKKRLTISNILMIIIPIFITVIIVFSCLFFTLFYISRTKDITFSDANEFNTSSHLIIEMLESDAEDDGIIDYANLVSYLDSSSSSILIIKDGINDFSYGEIPSSLLSLCIPLSSRASIINGDENIYKEDFNRAGSSYNAYFYSRNISNDTTGLERTFTIILVILVISIALSIYFTNRILIKFIFRNIEKPLDLLLKGFEELKKGNLDYEIRYKNDDEFKPVFLTFNEMAARLKESVETVKKEEEKSRELMASLSHDLRSPLTSIKAYVEGLIDGVAKNEDQKIRYVKTIRDKTEELEKIVNRILSYTKMEVIKEDEELKIMRLDLFLKSLIENIKDDYRERGLDITLKTTPLSYAFNSFLLEEIVFNIADNSLKYKNKDRACLIIELKNDTLTFKDDGPGIKEEDKEKIFDLFFREDEARADRRKGSGLGLAIVKRASERLNAKVSSKNGENGGLIIEIALLGEKYGENFDN